MTGEEVESGSTATVIFVGNDVLVISHVGDSSVVYIPSPLDICNDSLFLPKPYFVML